MIRKLKKYQQGGSFRDQLFPENKPVVDQGNFSKVKYTPAQKAAMQNANLVRKNEEKKKLQDEIAARQSKEKGTPYKLPTGVTKKYKDMTLKERAYVDAQSLRNKGRWNENQVEQPFLNTFNPITMLYDMAAGLGEAPLTSDVSNSYMPYVTGVVAPLAVGAFAGIGAKTTGQFVNNLVNPLADIVNAKKIKDYQEGFKRVLPEKQYLIGEFSGNKFKELKKLALSLSPNTTQALGKLDANIAKEMLNDYRFGEYSTVKDFRRTVKKALLESERLKKINPNVDFSRDLGIQSWMLKKPENLKNFADAQLMMDKSLSSQKKFLNYIEDEYNKKINLINNYDVFKNIAEESPQYTDLIYDHLKNPQVPDNIFLDNLVKQSNTFIRAVKNPLNNKNKFFNISGRSITKSGKNTMDVEGFPVSNIYGDYRYKIEPDAEKMAEIASAPLEEKWSKRFLDNSNISNDNINLEDGWLTQKSEDYSNWFKKRRQRNNQVKNVPMIVDQPMNIPQKYLNYPQHKIFTSDLNEQVLKGFDLSELNISNKDAYKYLPGFTRGFKKGGIIQDDRGQWAHPGQVTQIGSPNITMRGVNYPVLGVGADGQEIMMQPGGDYTFNQAPVTEYPMMQGGGGFISNLKKAYVDAYNNYNSRTFPAETLPQRQKAYRTINPSSYLDLRNYGRWVSDKQRDESYDPRSEEAFKFYLGLSKPEDLQYIRKSQYRPTINATDKYYYAVDPELEQDIFNAYKDKVKLNETLQTDESEFETALSGKGAAGLLGRFGVSKGHDENGDYLSYYDRYDLKDFAQKRTKGVPYSIYNRIYYPKKEQGGEMINYKSGGQMIKRADGSYSRPGLWDNIRKNAGSGKKPTAQMLEQERKIRNKYQEGGSTKQNPPKEYTDYKAFKKAERLYKDSLNLYNNNLNYKNKYLDFVNKAGFDKTKVEEWPTDGYVNTEQHPTIGAISNGVLKNSGGGFRRDSKGNPIYFNYFPLKNGKELKVYTDSFVGSILNKRYYNYKKPVEPVVYKPQSSVNKSKQSVNANRTEVMKKPIIPNLSEEYQYKKWKERYGIEDEILDRLPMLPYLTEDSDITMNSGQFKVPAPVVQQPKGRPVYGPGNTIIGYNNNMHFTPALQYTGAPNNASNLQDKALLENPDALRQYVSKLDNYRFDKGGVYSQALNNTINGLNQLSYFSKNSPDNAMRDYYMNMSNYDSNNKDLYSTNQDLYGNTYFDEGGSYEELSNEYNDLSELQAIASMDGDNELYEYLAPQISSVQKSLTSLEELAKYDVIKEELQRQILQQPQFQEPSIEGYNPRRPFTSNYESTDSEPMMLGTKIYPNMKLKGSPRNVKAYLTQKGLSRNAIAGIMGNIEHESSFNPGIGGDQGTSFGLFQHHAKRKDNLLSYLKKRNLDKTSIEGQIDFALSEYPQLIQKLNKAVSPQQAADIWVREFEKPANVEKQSKLRQRAALKYMKQGGTLPFLKQYK